MKRCEQDDRALAKHAHRRARMERLLFAGATLATTALTLGTVVAPKLPPFVGE